MIFKIFKDTETKPTVEIVKCHECGHLIEKCDGQEVIWIDLLERGVRYYCKPCKRPYDKYVGTYGVGYASLKIVNKFYKRNPEYSEVDENGKPLKSTTK